MTRGPGSTVILLACLVLLVVPGPASAARQVPVGYQLLAPAGSPFLVFYPPRLHRMASEFQRLLAESAGPIEAELGLEKIAPIEVILASGEETYRILHGGSIPEWGIAFSDVSEQVLGVNVDAVLRNPAPLAFVVRHELSHLLLAQRVRGAPVPHWFMEGLAMRQSGEWNLSDEWRLMTLAARRDIPDLGELDRDFPMAPDRAALAYGVSYLAVSDLLRDRPGALMTLTAFTRDTGDFDRAFASTFGVSTEAFAGRISAALERRYRTPGTILNASPYWLAAALLFVAVFAIKRYRTRRKLARWADEEARRSPFDY